MIIIIITSRKRERERERHTYHELGFPNIILHFKVNKSEFNVMVAISSHPVEALKKSPKNTQKHTKKTKTVP